MSEKLAAHQHDRGLERLKLPKESIDAIQRAADRMYYSHGRRKLLGDNYFSKLRDQHHNTAGYAAFKRVGNPYNGRLILATILSKEMRPRGTDITDFFNVDVKGQTPKVPGQLEKYKGMTPIPGSKGS